jgi:putative intracellular protease/amidase
MIQTCFRIFICVVALLALQMNSLNSKADQSTIKTKDKRVLIVVTSHDQLGINKEKTGYWLSELSHPLFALLNAGYKIDIASPKGGNAPIDPRSKTFDDPENKKLFDNSLLLSKIQHTVKLNTIKPNKYAAILFAGGHGPMWDFTENKDIDRLARSIYEKGGIVAAVCHGPAALVNIKLSNGKYLIDGKRLTAFSNSEEESVDLQSVVPYALETKLKERGAKYEAAANQQKNVVVDDRLVTGQNPASAAGVGEAIAKLLETE